MFREASTLALLTLGLVSSTAAQVDYSVPLPGDCSAVPARLYLAGPRHPGVPDSVVADDVPTLHSAVELRMPPKYTTTASTVRIRFQLVVDSTGRAIPCSIKALDTSEPEFVQAGREALFAAEYMPAHQAGRPVPMRIQQPLVWHLPLRAGP